MSKTHSVKDAWNPTQYDKFKVERSQPFFDLMSLVDFENLKDIVDLGCGAGELTAALHQKSQSKSTLGIDNSEEMLKKAHSHSIPGLKFETGNIENWKAPKGFDLVFSNAALHWCNHHPELFRRLKDSLKPGGQLAIQMPFNHDYPTHVIATQMSQEEPWISILNSETYDQRNRMLTLEKYAELMFSLGFQKQQVLIRVYAHQLKNRDGVIEWVQGTLLTHFKSRMTESDYQSFLNEFRTRLYHQLRDESPFFYPFQRIFIWGQLS